MTHPAHYKGSVFAAGMRESEAAYQLPPLAEYETWCRLRGEAMGIKHRGTFLKSIMNEPKKLRDIALAKKKGALNGDLASRYGLTSHHIWTIMKTLPEELK